MGKLTSDGAVSKGLADCGHLLHDEKGLILAAEYSNTPKLDVIDIELSSVWEGPEEGCHNVHMGNQNLDQERLIDCDDIIGKSLLIALFSH